MPRLKSDSKKATVRIKDSAVTALITAPTLAVILFSSVYNVIQAMLGADLNTDIPIMLSVLTFFSVIATAVLSFVYSKKLPLAFTSIIFFLCFISNLCYSIGLAEGLKEGGFLENLLTVFSFPMWSILPLGLGITESSSATAFVIALIIVIVNAVALVLLFLKERAESDTDGR